MAIQIQLRRGTASQWTAANTLLAQGEIGLETDTSKLKLGDGSTLWNSLSYFSAGSGVTAVTATSPVVSSGGLTPVISMPAATTSVNGYLTSTDWNTFNGKGSGTVTSVAATAGTGISVSGSPITTSGTLTITNSAPDQTVVLTAGTGISTSGTYPNFTITNSSPDQTVALTAGTGISTSGTYPNFTVTNSAPDQTVALTQAGTTTITGTYPNFTISSADQFQGTVTSVTGTAPVVSSGGATPAISMAAATTSVSGYLTSTDWTTFNNKGSGTVTSVAATVPSFLSVSGSPITTSGTLAITLSGTALPIANGGTGATTLAGASIATYTGTETLTNKRIDPRVTSAASASSLTPSVATADVYAYTALAAGLTINAPTGTPVDGDKLMFRLLDNGTSRSLTWDATYTVIGVTLPTATTISKTTYVGCIYNANNTRWDVIAVTTQA